MLLVIIFTFCCLISIICRLTRSITRSSTCLVGKTAIITGANSGLGYQTALNLASRGCKIIMADIADMEQSKNNIIKYTNNPNIITRKLDLSSLKSVRDFASHIIETENRLDLLINNAGIGMSQEETTTDGLNPVMQINYFGHFLLTHLLIDLLKKSAPSRIVFTSSLMSTLFNNLSLKNLNPPPKTPQTVLNITRFYSNSKLAMLIASDLFAKKLIGTGVTSNSLHPGLVTTAIQTVLVKKCNICVRFMFNLFHIMFAKDPWAGSQCLVHVAVSKKLESVTGKFFIDCIPFVKPFKAYDDEWCQKVWKLSEELVKLAPEEKI